MDAISSTAASSNADIQDILRLIGPNDRAGFLEMLAHELRGREPLPDGELRCIAERTWRLFNRVGWPRACNGPSP
jgi:hypothetical protein